MEHLQSIVEGGLVIKKSPFIRYKMVTIAVILITGSQPVVAQHPFPVQKSNQEAGQVQSKAPVATGLFVLKTKKVKQQARLPSAFDSASPRASEQYKSAKPTATDFNKAMESHALDADAALNTLEIK